MGKNKNGYGKGTFIESQMFLSPAFLSLGQPRSCEHVSSISVHILICLLAKRKFAERRGNKGKIHERVDDNKFVFTYKEMTAPPLNFTQPRATRGLDELLAKGFIAIVDPGGAYEKHKALYGLVDDWQFWKPGAPPVRKRNQDAKKGFQGRGLGAVKKTQHTPTLPTHTHTDVAHPLPGTHTPTLKTEKGQIEQNWQ